MENNKKSRAKMIDVGGKSETERTAVASGTISVSGKTIKEIKAGRMKKGDVLSVAQTAGIMGVKKTPDIIPLCHPISIDGVEVNFNIDDDEGEIVVTANVKSTGKTGVEMEALTACSMALLTIYDMCKSIDKGMDIKKIHLLEKRGGASGTWKRRVA